jgi:phospholipase C
MSTEPPRPPRSPRSYNRRTVLRAGLGAAAAAAVPFGLGRGLARAGAATRSGSSPLRWPTALPYPSLPVGQVTNAFPFDHIVIAMMENHSFDNYLGMLPQRGQPKADGFTFDAKGNPTNWNPIGHERMPVYHQAGAIGASDTGSQSWDDSHKQINGGAMNGFAGTGPGSMGYYTDEDLPFYYSLANTFCLANRWFCSAPAQTYPNRRFLMSATASGIISTDIDNISINYPVNGTIWDLLSKHHISWRNYFSDAPTSIIMFDTVLKHPLNLAPIEEFYLDCALGSLPSVSLVDCDMGAITGEAAGLLSPFKIPTFDSVQNIVDDTGQSEENPEDVQLGEQFMAGVTHAVMSGPAWHRTLLVWLYDEHGGYYDHVAPPRAPRPDITAPMLSAQNQPGDYSLYGPRVPAVVISPYSRPHEVTDVVHDHTSILATIEQQWNLPALTFRDANAASLIDFLDTSHMAFAEPPALVKPANPLPELLKGYAGQPKAPAPTP